MTIEHLSYKTVHNDAEELQYKNSSSGSIRPNKLLPLVVVNSLVSGVI